MITKASKQQAISTIKHYYREKGYWFTDVKVREGKLDTVRNNRILYFHVDPGERLEIKEIEFVGNKHFSDRKLRSALSSLEEDRWWKFFKKKTFKEKKLRKAERELQTFYGAHGFLDFQILMDTVKTFPYTQHRLYFLTTPATGLKVKFKVSEGHQYYVRNITFNGNTVYSDELLKDVLGFEKGEVFNKKQFHHKFSFSPKGTDINSMYQNAGYLFSQIRPNIHIVGGDSVDIVVNIYEDEKATIHLVTFSGNTKTSDDVVRRNIRTIPGNTYSQARVIRTVRELSTLGFFVPKSIKPHLDPNRKKNTVNIHYDLEESPSTSNFQFSGGYGGSRIGVILSARVQFNNFSLQRAIHGKGWNPIPSGGGETVSLGVRISGNGYQSYHAGYQQPWLGGKPTSLGVNISYNSINYRNSFFGRSLNLGKQRLFSASVAIGRRLKWPDNYFQLQSILSYQLYDVHNAGFLAEGTSNILSIKEVLVRNSLDNFISPTRGSKLKLSFEIAPPLPGFSQFYKIKTYYQNNATIVGNLVLTNTIQFGYLGYLGPNQHSNFKRFVLGGSRLQQRQSFVTDNIELRGYPGGRAQGISPRTPSGRVIGGRIFTKYSLELRIPVVSNKKLKVIPYVFFDAGNVYRGFQDFEPFNLKRSVGPGVRLYLPILGLIGISYGYRLDGIPATFHDSFSSNQVAAGEWEFLFNIGRSFNAVCRLYNRLCHRFVGMLQYECNGSTAVWLYQLQQDLEKMPEYTGIQQKLERISSRWQAELRQMKQRIDSLQSQFKTNKLLYSDERKAREKNKIQHLIEQRKQYLHNKFGPHGRYFQKQKQLLKPIQRKLYKAVSKVANEKNIDFVFDRANNTALFFARKQWNLNKEVLQALHVTLDK